MDSPLIVKGWKSSVGGTWKKKKSDISTGTKLMFLTKGDIDEIGDTIHTVMEDLWANIEDQYKLVLTKIQRASRSWNFR